MKITEKEISAWAITIDDHLIYESDHALIFKTKAAGKFELRKYEGEVLSRIIIKKAPARKTKKR